MSRWLTKFHKVNLKLEKARHVGREPVKRRDSYKGTCMDRGKKDKQGKKDKGKKGNGKKRGARCGQVNQRYRVL